MKALSVKHLYACAILLGVKTLEIRDKCPSELGEWCICSTKRQGDVGFDRRNTETMRILEMMVKLPQGHALCVVDVVGYRPMLPGDEAEAMVKFDPSKRQIAWKISNPRPIDPFRQFRGNVTKFYVDDSLIQYRRASEDRLSIPTKVPPFLGNESRSSFVLQQRAVGSLQRAANAIAASSPLPAASF